MHSQIAKIGFKIMRQNLKPKYNFFVNKKNIIFFQTIIINKLIIKYKIRMVSSGFLFGLFYGASLRFLGQSMKKQRILKSNFNKFIL